MTICSTTLLIKTLKKAKCFSFSVKLTTHFRHLWADEFVKSWSSITAVPIVSTLRRLLDTSNALLPLTWQSLSQTDALALHGHVSLVAVTAVAAVSDAAVPCRVHWKVALSHWAPLSFSFHRHSFALRLLRRRRGICNNIATWTTQ